MISLLILASWGWETQNFDGWPPARFTGDTKAQVTFVAPDKVAKACEEKDPDHVLEACQDGGHIVLPNPCTFPLTDNYARLACHELAHRSGWAGNHPR